VDFSSLRILFISAWGAADSGVFRFQYKWLKELAVHQGVSLYWYYPLKSGCPENDMIVSELGVKVIEGGHKIQYCKEVCDDVNNILDNYEIDIVHINTGHIEFQYMLAVNCFKNKDDLTVICHSHGSGRINESWLRKILHLARYVLRYQKGRRKLYLPFKGFMRKTVKNRATVCAACSKAAGEWLYGKGISLEPKWHLINNTIDTEEYAFSPDQRAKIRNELELFPELIVLGNVGAFQRIKNHVYLVDVLYEAVKLGINAKLLIVGDGYMRECIKSKIKERGMEDRVVLYGRVNTSAEVLSAFDVFLMPSESEGFSIAAIEAQASGLPCIFSMGCSEEMGIIDDCKFCDTKKISHWVAGIKELINEDCSAKKRISRNQEVRIKGYDDTCVSHYVDLLYGPWLREQV